MNKAIIFDFDGVLVSSETPRFQFIQKLAAGNGIKIPDVAIKKMVGRTTANFLSDVLLDSQKPLIDKIIKEYEREYKGNITKYVKPIEFTVNFIKNYKGQLILALASMSSRKEVEKLIKYIGIYEKFKLIVCREEVTNHKPNPEIYLKTAAKLGIEPSNCIVIEDTVIGAQSALNASMKCYVVVNELNNREEFAGILVEGFVNTKEDLERIN